MNDGTGAAGGAGFRASRRSRSFHRSSPPVGDRHVDRADAVRRFRGRAALDALVSEPGRPRQAGLRGEPADAQGGSGSATARRASSSSTRAATRRRARRSSRRCSAPRPPMPGARTSSYFSTGNLMYVSRDRHTTFEQIYPAGQRRARHAERRGEDARRGADRPAGRHHRQRDGSRRARRGQQARLERRVERAAGGADRRARRAGDPAVRVRDAAGGADAARRRDRGDPQHLHARAGR